jgi:hypothetical protein
LLCKAHDAFFAAKAWVSAEVVPLGN